MNNTKHIKKLINIFKQLWIPLFLLLFVLVFSAKSTAVITALLVEPLMVTIEHSNIFTDVIVILGFASTTGLFIYCAKQRQVIGTKSIAYIVLVSIVYLYYRLPAHSSFEFVHFKIASLSNLVLADVLLSPIIGLAFYFAMLKKELPVAPTVPNNQRGFYIDNPIVLTASNDIFKRIAQITELKDRLLATVTTLRSFAISINGKWGAGKSTFIRTLKSQLNGEQDIIVMDFNPWKASGQQAVTQIFFTDLSAKLAPHNRSLELDITEYSKELLNNVDNSTVKFLQSLVSPSKPPELLQDRYDRINALIRELNKKVVVFIDDIDRLATSEIMDVLRIIRNTADFGNIYFIAAFDKVYVASRMSEEISVGAGQYLEKIFQLEYYLSLHSQRSIFIDDVIAKLRTEVLQVHQPLLDKILENDANFFVSEIRPPLEVYLHSFRDVNRFMNVFVTNYQRIAENIYLPDYLSMCMLRLKYPEVYSYLYYNKYDFLKSERSFDLYGVMIRGYESGALELKFENGNGKNLEESDMYRILSAKPQLFALDKSEVPGAVELMSRIFPTSKSRGGFVQKRSMTDNYLSIADASCFDRYFAFSMDGRVDQKEFNELFLLPWPEIKKKMQGWNENSGTALDMQIKLEKYEAFDSKEQFEKMIRVILYYSELHVSRNPTYPNQYNADNFYMKFGGPLQGNSIVKRFYNGDPEPLRQFFKSLYAESIALPEWRFIHEFVVNHLKHFEDKFIVSFSEMKELIRDCMLTILREGQIIDLKVMDFYNHAIRLFVDESNREKIVPVGDGILITEALKKAALADFNRFLDFCVYKYNPVDNGYVAGSWQEVIFGNDENFLKELENRKDDPKVQEFSQFYEQFRREGKKAIQNFPFKLINPQ